MVGNTFAASSTYSMTETQALYLLHFYARYGREFGQNPKAFAEEWGRFLKGKSFIRPPSRPDHDIFSYASQPQRLVDLTHEHLGSHHFFIYYLQSRVIRVIFQHRSRTPSLAMRPPQSVMPG